MSATVIFMPVVHRPNFSDPSWREQYQREIEALNEAPGRTRPLLVVDNAHPVPPWQLVDGMLLSPFVSAYAAAKMSRDNFQFHMRALRDVFSDDT